MVAQAQAAIPVWKLRPAAAAASDPARRIAGG